MVGVARTRPREKESGFHTCLAAGWHTHPPLDYNLHGKMITNRSTEQLHTVRLSRGIVRLWRSHYRAHMDMDTYSRSS